MTDTPEKKAHIIVVSNEKGGTGKSTIAMHLAVKLMQEGFSVATIDLDGRQGSLSKYIENRKSFCEQKKIALPIPLHYRFEPESNAYLIPGEREKSDSKFTNSPGRLTPLSLTPRAPKIICLKKRTNTPIPLSHR